MNDWNSPRIVPSLPCQSFHFPLSPYCAKVFFLKRRVKSGKTERSTLKEKKILIGKVDLVGTGNELP